MATWQEINQKRKPFIRMGERLFKGMYNEIRRSFITEILKAERPEEIERVIEGFRFDVDMRTTFERFYTKVTPAFAADTVKRYKSGKGPTTFKDEDLWLEKVLEFVRVHSGAKITSIIRSHYDDIERIAKLAVETGIDKGWGMDQIARMISKEQGLIDNWKALRIARTETVAASNYGVELGAEDLPGNKQKVWISSFTVTSREDHMAMDGVQEDLKRPFILPDGTELRFPGDPTGPPEQIINCRCGYEVIITDEIF